MGKIAQGVRRCRRLISIDGDEGFRVLDRAPWLGGAPRGPLRKLNPAALGCPVSPTKIIGVGRNDPGHARELGHASPLEPILFLKPPSALVGPGDEIVLPRESCQVEHEAELGVVIGRRARNVPVAAALEYVLGYTCVGDITARDLQRRDVQCTRGKGFDTFCPVGPSIVAGLDPDALDIRCRVNGELRQRGFTSDYAFSVATIVSFASTVMTLEPGDLIATGTPAGVGPLAAGDRLELEVSGVGVLAVSVASS